jgi:hypothetical protein
VGSGALLALTVPRLLPSLPFRHSLSQGFQLQRLVSLCPQKLFSKPLTIVVPPIRLLGLIREWTNDLLHIYDSELVRKFGAVHDDLQIFRF